MRIERGRAIQCVILAIALAAEIICAAPGYADESPMEQDTRGTGAETEERDRTGTVLESDTWKKSVEAAKLTWEQVPVALEDGEFTFGALHVVLPEESTWEYVTREDGTLSVCLSAAEKPASFKKMYFTHYRVAWADTWELKLAALKLTGLDRGRWFFLLEEEEPRNRTFGIEMAEQENQKNFYVLVQGEDLYLLEDEDAKSYKFLFGDREDEENLTWDDVGGCIAPKYGCNYYQLGEQKEAYLEVGRLWGNDRIVFLYRDGDFERPAQSFDGNVWICEDINFDGIFDLSVYDEEREMREYLLWSQEEGRFVSATVPRDEFFYFRAGDDMVEEFETIWRCHNEWDSEAWERSGTTEKLYRWEDRELREMRRISSEITKDEVFVEFQDGESLVSGSFPKEGWQENPGVRELYEQFYEGYAPQEFYYTYHVAPGKEDCIPEELADLLAKALKDGTQEAALRRLKAGRMLSDREMEEAGLNCAEISDVLWQRDNYDGAVEMVQVDLDNDGIEDLYGMIYGGGSGGFADYVLYQGTAGGEYRKTGYGSGSIINEFTPVHFEGKNYLCRTLWDYDKKIMAGLILEEYRDGRMVETMTLSLVQGKTDITLRSCREGYREMAEKERAKAEDIFEKTEHFRPVIGDAEQKETEEDSTFRGDIDNDGVEERYEKYIWTPSNLGTVSILDYEMEEENVRDTALNKAIFENCGERGVPIMFWVDAWGKENIVNVMYGTGLYDYVIEGYLPRDTGDYESLYLIEKKSKRAVETTRAGQNTKGQYGGQYGRP